MTETDIKQQKLFDGVTVVAINLSKFKSTRIEVGITVPLTAETASAYSMLPYLLSRCCKEYPSFAALNRRLAELYGAAVSVAVHKSGDSLCLNIGVEAPDDRFSLDGGSIVGDSARLLCEMLFAPEQGDGGLNSSEFENERRILIDRIERAIDEKRVYASHKCDSIMCEGEPFALPESGTVETAAALTASGMRDIWRRVMETADFKISVAGRGSADAVVEIFRTYFSKLDRAPAELAESIVKPAGELKTVSEEMDVRQGKLVIGFRSGARHSIGSAVPVKVMVDIFGGGPYSLLFENVREKMSLCYYCSARYDRLKSLIKVNSGVEDSNAESARNEIIRQFDTLRRGEFSDELLETSKRAIVEMCAAVYDSNGALSSWYRSQLDEERIFSPEEYAELVAKVTRDDIIAAANEFAVDTVFVLKGKEQE